VPVGADDKLAKVTIYAVFIGGACKKQRLGRQSHNTNFMDTNTLVAGKQPGKYSAKISIGKDGFFTISQEPPGSGEFVLHFSSAASFAEDVLTAAKQAEAAYKSQAK
jgi:hypothetical protein